MTLFHLFWIFFYIGLFAIGGGLVAASFMYQILVEQYGLLSAEKFYNMLAISESTPGPIGINLATYLGTELFGPAGALVTTFGEVLPSFIVITLIARFFTKFHEKPLVNNVFVFLRPATAGLILVAYVRVLLISLINVDFSFGSFSEFWSGFRDNPWQALEQVFNFKAVWLFVISVFLLFKAKVHPIFIIVASALFGIIFF